jgi:hypothetical protein
MGFWDCGQQGRWPKFFYFYLKLIFFYVFRFFDALILKIIFLKIYIFNLLFKKYILKNNYYNTYKHIL